MPATYVPDSAGKVLGAFVEMDYTQRMELADIILVQPGWSQLFAAFDNIPDSWYLVVSLSNRGEWS